MEAFSWSGRRESNPLISAWKAKAMPYSARVKIAVPILYLASEQGLSPTVSLISLSRVANELLVELI